MWFLRKEPVFINIARDSKDIYSSYNQMDLKERHATVSLASSTAGMVSVLVEQVMWDEKVNGAIHDPSR